MAKRGSRGREVGCARASTRVFDGAPSLRFGGFAALRSTGYQGISGEEEKGHARRIAHR
jgi:hypothetical protein